MPVDAVPPAAGSNPALDHQRLLEALALAELAIGVSDPNPRVGCVIGFADGRVLGRGVTQAVGQAHAEVMALQDARSHGADVRGATAWVTLEPCAHHGRTPPCCEALIAAGIARAVVAVVDPHLQVAGGGLARLRAAGVQVDLEPADGAVATAARQLNIGFFSRVERGTPWVRLKIAASLDGRTALPNGRSQWITGEAARIDTHAWRRRAGAVLTGIGTVLADDPRLDVRHVTTALQPLRVVADSALRTPAAARILAPPGRTLIATAQTQASPRAALEAAGAQIWMAGASRQPPGGIDLRRLLQELGARGVNELHVEAGERLNGALLADDLVDEILIYLAPVLMGAGRGMATLAAAQTLDQLQRFDLLESAACGVDLRIRALTKRRDN